MTARKWVGIESATSVGKTYCLPRIIYWFLDTFPNSLVITTAPKKDQLKKILWTEMGNAYHKFKKIRPHSEFITLNIAVDKRTKKTSTQKVDDSIEGGMGWEVLGIVSGVAAGEDSATKMQGFHRENMLFVIDEMAGVHPAVLTAIINTCTAPNNLIIGVGNPDSQIDTLHTFCQLKKTEHIIVSAYDHPNVVNKRMIIPGAVSVESIDMRKEEYGEESNFYKSRVRGIAPEEGTGSLFRAEYIDQCYIYNKDKFHGNPEKIGNNAVGVDVANSEQGDMACLAWGKGNKLFQLQEFQCDNATHLAYNMMYDTHELARFGYKNYNTLKIKDYKIHDRNIGIDTVGVGVATINAFYDKRKDVVALIGGQLQEALNLDNDGNPLYNFQNLRSQMYFEFREDLRTNGVILDLDKKTFLKLKKELLAHTYKVSGGKIFVESKDDIKKKLGGKSPNLSDSAVYWNFVRKNYYKKTMSLPFSGSAKK
ncbi:MAG TPA: hypothetical protein PKX59_10500 [Bacteroidia bacterium]|nr:hypothetical protein [Bacteroidia bacterium]HRB52071.1 hypothetical protein [Bacteroidia bacterium]